MGKRRGTGQAPKQAHGRMHQGPLRRGRIACAKQSNADMLQLSAAEGGDDSWNDNAKGPMRDAQRRLAQLTERDNSMKTYMKEMRKVLENADVILEVLDVRDPLGCRAYAVEREAAALGKRIVLILNKIDLVPQSNTRAWLEYLRDDFPTLPFKASTQQQRNNLGQGPSLHWKQNTTKHDAQLGGGAEAAGTRALLQLIKNYSRNLNLKSSITVGIIGAPNVGKSSLINSLKRSRVCGVAATPGHTKVMQGIMLDRQVRLLDSPGIVFTDSNAPLGATQEEAVAAAEAAMLRNVLKVELVDDPIEPVQTIVNRVGVKYLCSVYGIPEFGGHDAHDFLLRVAYQKGRLGRGALPDVDATARSVLHEWNTGKIRYHTDPPKRRLAQGALRTADGQGLPSEGGDAVLSTFSKAFDLAALLGSADAEAFGGDGAYEATAAVPGLEEEAPADATSSTLGKHDRALDSSDDEHEWPPHFPARPNAFEALAHDAESEADVVSVPKRSKEKPMFTPAEQEYMAVPRGAQRRKARKEKKRSTIGLATSMDALMDLDDRSVSEEEL
ncbi:nuclear GTP-binding protein nug1 [Malassezia vespertilionis]|uniref:CP-type G domain-containing protein n=1 Tax=Malassezia vespertilionis TaxID=2020962 RepID=A0A2N1JA18_9BASI|nr:nuclear GTP-binding protein nug1 [Malassezia vespertilionis]PKI83399.1 hypothetical protein MVES_002428 [Malassezia vespertilionis]WFD07212.1 nuclear GTP-binding protein nug1 [Malassezia vespertilionis]